MVEVSVDDFHVGLVRLNRPEARNALSPEMREELAESLERLDADPEVRCIVIAGNDEFFAAGADIRAMAERPLDAPADPSGIGVLEPPRRRSGRRLIAAVSGYAFGGGCELALACDMIVCDEKARFGQPEITLGIIPGGGGTQRLARAIGKQRAMEYVLTGRRWDAETAERWGLVNKVAGEGAWLSEAIELARRSPSARRWRCDWPNGRCWRAEETRSPTGLRGRARALRRGDGDRGPGRGDERLPGEARAAVQGPMSVSRVGVVGAGTMGARHRPGGRARRLRDGALRRRSPRRRGGRGSAAPRRSTRAPRAAAGATTRPRPPRRGSRRRRSSTGWRAASW